MLEYLWPMRMLTSEEALSNQVDKMTHTIDVIQPLSPSIQVLLSEFTNA